MTYDINSFIYAFDENDTMKLKGLAYLYHRHLIYVNESEYEFMEILFNVIIDRLYDMPDREVQGDYFDVLDEGININLGKYKRFYHCIDRLTNKIEKVSMSFWELAETLRIIGGTMDRRYYNLMEKYKDHEDAYVREMVEEYFYDLKIEEKELDRKKNL